MSLVDYHPYEYTRMCWTFSWDEILKFYNRKQKEYFDKRSADYEFLVNLASAALGGKGSSAEGEVGIDSGEGLEEMTEEQIAALKSMLGDDYSKIYEEQ